MIFISIARTYLFARSDSCVLFFRSEGTGQCGMNVWGKRRGLVYICCLDRGTGGGEGDDEDEEDDEEEFYYFFFFFFFITCETEKKKNRFPVLITSYAETETR